MVFKDYYKILELETSKVSIEEIKSAYRLVAKKYHPDVNIGDKMAEEKIKDINEAYRTLSNVAQKRKYDRIWNSNVGKHKNQKGKVEKNYIFNMFLGNVDLPVRKKEKEPTNGENIETRIQASLEDAFFGKTKTIVIKNIEGKDKTYQVQLPAGIRNGEKVRLIGQGKKGINGGKDGDLIIDIQIPEDKKFKLKGYDLYTDLLIAPWEACLGNKVKIKTIGEEIEVFIPQGIQTGEKIKIPNKGYKDARRRKRKLVCRSKSNDTESFNTRRKDNL